jgi:hypothetical protein
VGAFEAQCSQFRRDADLNASRINEFESESREARLASDEAQLALEAAWSSAALEREAAVEQHAAQRATEERLQEALAAAQAQASQQAEAAATAAAAERASAEGRHKAAIEELAEAAARLKMVRVLHAAALSPSV